LLFSSPVSAQEVVRAVLSGQLLVAGLPADTGTVVLHLVTPEVAEAIDSIQVEADGTFTFSLPRLPIPASGEVYFVSSRHSGVMYLGPVIGEPALLDSLYVVPTFPSVSAPIEGVRFPLALREVWIQEGPSGWQLTDTFILSNSSTETLVAAGDSGIVWRYPLPEGARNARVLDAGLLPGELWTEEGSVVSAKPLIPGSSRFILQYDVPSLDFVMPLPGEVELMRVVMEEPLPDVTIEGLARMEPVEIEPGTFVAYWAGEDLVDQGVAVRFGEESAAVPPVVWFSVGLAALLAGAGIWGVGRRSAAVHADPSSSLAPRSRCAVLLAIARLDLAHNHRSGSGSGNEDYHARRAALMRELDQLR
jgi:hypothetical protein